MLLPAVLTRVELVALDCALLCLQPATIRDMAEQPGTALDG